MQLSEVDVFKSAEKSPKVISRNESYKTLYKVWSGYTKFIRSNINKGLNVSCEFGRFISSESLGVMYLPSPKFITSGNFTYKNLDLFSNESKDKRLDQHISYSAIAYVCDLNRDQAQKCMQEIVSHILELVRQGNSIKLNFKIGLMTLRDGLLDWKPIIERKNKANYSLDSTTSRESSVLTPRSSRCTNIRLGSLSVHASNPNPIYQGPSKNLNNYYRGLSYKPQNTVPLPCAFYTGKIHPLFDFRTKYTRRQACDLAISPQDLLDIHREQIREKAKKLKETKEIKKLEEDGYIKTVTDQMKKDREDKEYSDYIKKSLFIEENNSLIERKKERKKQIKKERLGETYDYFPFTHGDQIEAQQKTLNLALREDLRKHSDTLNSTFAAFSSSPQSPRVRIDIPKFMIPDEYSPRFLKNYEKDLAMENALERYEQELIEKEKNNEKLMKEKLEREIIDKKYQEDVEMKHRKKLEKYRKKLEEQISEKIEKKQEEKIEKMSPVKTHFGPEESKEDLENEIKFKMDRERENKEFVAKQMIEKLEERRQLKERDREEDYMISKNVEKIMCEEDDKNKEKIKKGKNFNKNVWLKQIKLKELEKSLDAGAGF
ncbi:unnamed protein product [Blepharisma stoltei]|uniref:CCDC81 HU domain-containing protein n=1 Tax=Blepharisma stoltei TaxID=1481888 RepID=A0AAU9J2G6_9CILI|nr:unnamed protein product [Blepharisma stoltei]